MPDRPSPSAPQFPIHPLGLVGIAIITTQMGSAFAKSLFPQVGPAGMVLLRVGLAAIALLLFWRPRWTAVTRQHLPWIIAFGATLALMNFSFYLAIARLPIGIAVALEFTGPLGLAVFSSRQWLDVMWAVLAGIGIVLLTPWGGFEVDPWGIGFALMAATGWASYIICASKIGQVLSGGQGLAWAMVASTAILLPIGFQSAKIAVLHPQLMGMALGVALLSTVVPYSCELEALRSLPVYVVGILLSLEPVVAALTGWLILGETLTVRAMMAVVLVAIAAAGVSRPKAVPLE
ncbi:MAG: EamA family transporter [Leptolyngbyaceae bacterium]|nr:EamA family transporter [Leptolyngbyaceae bacterium]